MSAWLARSLSIGLSQAWPWRETWALPLLGPPELPVGTWIVISLDGKEHELVKEAESY